jgi:hypothetical protein
MRAGSMLLRAAAALLVAAAGSAAADALSTLNDSEVFKHAEQDVAQLDRTELEALAQTVATCVAVTIGQRPQQFECERQINFYWARYGRDRALDNYLTAYGGLLAAYDANPLGTTPQMNQTYRRASDNLVALTKRINARYRQLGR